MIQFLTYFTFPVNWLNDVKGTVGELFTDFFPIIILIVGVGLVLLVIRVLAGFAR